MATELIYRTKLRRLTNTAHYALVRDIHNMSCRSYLLGQKLQQALSILDNALKKEADYVLKKYDKTLTANLKEVIRVENKAFTAVYKTLKYKLANDQSEENRRAARSLVVSFDTYMKDRGKKTLGEWVGCEARLIEEWSGNDGRQQFEKLRMTDMLNEILSKHSQMIDIYHEIKSKMVSFGYTKIAQYRQETDSAMSYLASTYLILTFDPDPNIANEAKSVIDGLNFMIEQFSEHLTEVASEGQGSENGDVNVVPNSNSQDVSEGNTDSKNQDEENAMRDNERDDNVVNGGSNRSIKSLVDKYNDAENPFDDIDNTMMSEIDSSLEE